jgi:hypothetical protein
MNSSAPSFALSKNIQGDLAARTTEDFVPCDWSCMPRTTSLPPSSKVVAGRQKPAHLLDDRFDGHHGQLADRIQHTQFPLIMPITSNAIPLAQDMTKHDDLVINPSSDISRARGCSVSSRSFSGPRWCCCSRVPYPSHETSCRSR